MMAGLWCFTNRKSNYIGASLMILKIKFLMQLLDPSPPEIPKNGEDLPDRLEHTSLPSEYDFHTWILSIDSSSGSDYRPNACGTTCLDLVQVFI